MGLARLLLQYAVVLDSSDFHVLTPPLIVYLSIARRLTECKVHIFTRPGTFVRQQQSVCINRGTHDPFAWVIKFKLFKMIAGYRRGQV